MNEVRVPSLFGALIAVVTALLAVEVYGKGEIHLWSSGSTGASVQVQGSADDDWLIQSSTNLLDWTTPENVGPLLGGDTNAPLREFPASNANHQFYRALRTEGLYDSSLLRTFSLTFSQANWQSLLTTARTTGVDVQGSLTVDNGATNSVMGARYKGNTSFTGMGSAPTKKSVNLDLDYTNSEARLMGFKTVNLNNAYGDETVMREPLYFNVMRQYVPCPQGALAKLNINGTYWGVYSLVEQENSDLIKRWFPSADGDRWRAPNVGGGTGGGAGGGGGGFSSAVSAFSYLGSTVSAYKSDYELKTDNSTNAWERLVHAIDVLNNTSSDQLRDKVEDVFAVDRWLWFLAIENIFADDDSYFNKGADYGFYYEQESGRIHPVEHDGNEAFTAGDASLSPVQGATGTNRPLLYKLLPINELRQRYLAHMRTVLEENFNPATLNPIIDRLAALSHDAMVADTKKSYTMSTYTNDLNALKSFIATRYAYLTNHAELRPLAPRITGVFDPVTRPSPTEIPWVTAAVEQDSGNGIDSVWLYFRSKSYGRFTAAQMFDDGLHGDGVAGDGIYGAATTNYPAGTKVRYYVEARSSNTAKAARFSPRHSEEDPYSYRVALAIAAKTPVVINELMAANTKTLADPQGEFDDWIELRNITDTAVDLSGHYLSDEPNNPRKWAFPDGTTIPASGYLLVWADEDGSDIGGSHASFKLSASGEQVYLTDIDANNNAVLDAVTFGAQTEDLSYGRSAADEDVLGVMQPTPGAANQ